jgi:uncharacterized protein
MSSEENKKVIDWPIIDAHTHFFPEKMFKAIWDFFEVFGWEIAHKQTPDGLVEKLTDHGVVRHTTLNYVRKPGQAKELNAWTSEFAKQHPNTIPIGTVHIDDPDPWATVAPYIESGQFYGIKLQPLVSEFGLDDPKLIPVFEKIIEHDKLLIAHAGTAPYTNEWLGIERLERLKINLPELTVIVAHMGAFEIDRTLDLLEKYDNVYVDTAMIYANTDVFETCPDTPMETLESISDRILFGSDFPNIPYPYSESIDSILRLEISDEAKEKIFYKNACKLFDIKV